MSDPPIDKSEASDQAKKKTKRRRINPTDECLDVRYKFWDLSAQFSALAVAILGFGVVWHSLRANNQTVRAEVQNGVLSHVMELSKPLIDKPGLYRYFYENATPPDDKIPCSTNGSVAKPETKGFCYKEVLVVAISRADVLDIVATQSIRFPDLWEDSEAWDQWIDDSLKNSPILRRYLDDKCTWYGKPLIQHLQKVMQGLETPEEISPNCKLYLNGKKAH